MRVCKKMLDLVKMEVLLISRNARNTINFHICKVTMTHLKPDLQNYGNNRYDYFTFSVNFIFVAVECLPMEIPISSCATMGMRTLQCLLSICNQSTSL